MGKTYIVKSRDGDSTNGLIMGRGNSTTKYGTDVANSRFFDFNLENSATSGANRGMYLRIAFTGAGTGSGESLRAFTNVDANIGTAHGAHISLDFAATAGGSECSGLGVANRCTLHIPNIASWAPTGTYAAVQSEIYSDGSASDPAGMTELSFFRVVNGGHASGKADVDDDAFFFSVQGFTDATGNLVRVAVPTTLAASLKCKVGSTTYYLPLYTAQS